MIQHVNHQKPSDHRDLKNIIILIAIEHVFLHCYKPHTKSGKSFLLDT